MRTINRCALLIIALVGTSSFLIAGEAKYEGTYQSAQFKNDRPNKFEGAITKDGETWIGEFVTDWKGKKHTYKGIMVGDIENGEVKGYFNMLKGNGEKGRRNFAFVVTSDGRTMKGRWIEIRRKQYKETISEFDEKTWDMIRKQKENHEVVFVRK